MTADSYHNVGVADDEPEVLRGTERRCPGSLHLIECFETMMGGQCVVGELREGDAEREVQTSDVPWQHDHP